MVSYKMTYEAVASRYSFVSTVLEKDGVKQEGTRSSEGTHTNGQGSTSVGAYGTNTAMHASILDAGTYSFELMYATNSELSVSRDSSHEWESLITAVVLPL